MGKSRPIIWSIAGNDSGGGAGLSADARAADACGVHLCPVVAAVTAQNSVGVARIEAIAPDVLDAQLAALAADMSPAAIKTGLLGSAQNIAVVARWVDALRARGPLALVVDPVLRASTGAAFADEAVLRAYVTELLPRATLITPNGGEAVRLVGALQGRDVVDERVGEGGLPLTPALSPEGRGRSGVDMHEAAAMDAVRPPPQPSPRGGGSQSLATPVAPVLPPLPPGEGAGVRGRPASAATSANTAPDAPTLAHALRAAGAQSVAITGGDSALGSGWSLDWLDTPHASGWLALPRIDTPHTHGTGCTFATSAAAALARGFVPADALVLAKQATTHAIAHGYAAGQGAGPVAARAGFATEPGLTPFMSWGANFDMAPPPFWGGLGWASTTADASKVVSPHPSLPPKGKGAGSLATLYAIVDSPARVRQLLQAGVRLVQLRIKTPAAPDAAWHAALRQSIAQ
ncbi:MAG: bifunctional hydroxymethylpyrimidine kinase/phosphomethylpyrimidine kinase, partial [Pseudomonadota bacterium]|nr:bifunctional hydroxymethylpyrimidine kinase/phosphomethylpyrimidine kinase [Pseudomonadota bacterium]